MGPYKNLATHITSLISGTTLVLTWNSLEGTQLSSSLHSVGGTGSSDNCHIVCH